MPAELFQILKDIAVKVLHLICQQFGKLSGGHRKGRSVFMLISKDSNAKECSDYCSVALILYSSKVMLQILQGLNST